MKHGTRADSLALRFVCHERAMVAVRMGELKMSSADKKPVVPSVPSVDASSDGESFQKTMVGLPSSLLAELEEVKAAAKKEAPPPAPAPAPAPRVEASPPEPPAPPAPQSDEPSIAEDSMRTVVGLPGLSRELLEGLPEEPPAITETREEEQAPELLARTQIGAPIPRFEEESATARTPAVPAGRSAPELPAPARAEPSDLGRTQIGGPIPQEFLEEMRRDAVASRDSSASQDNLDEPPPPPLPELEAEPAEVDIAATINSIGGFTERPKVRDRFDRTINTGILKLVDGDTENGQPEWFMRNGDEVDEHRQRLEVELTEVSIRKPRVGLWLGILLLIAGGATFYFKYL